MPGQNGRHNVWTIGNRTFYSESEFIAARDRHLRELAERLKRGRNGADSEEPRAEAPPRPELEPVQPEPKPVCEAAPPEPIDEPPSKKFRLFTAAQLDSVKYETRYLIPGVVAAGQPGGIFGAFKTLKTSLAADLLISLASGTPFLGRFPVAEPGRVLFFTGESGLPAARSIARRICAERGLSLEALDNFVISPDLPRLDRPIDLMALEELIRKQNAVCVVIDPAYLAIDGSKSRNLFAMGAMLRPLAELCESTGCTILLVHHCKRSQKVGNPATLDDIAWSGFGEFSAQWLLASRRRPYDPDTGHHELWLSAGGRSGHHGLWALDVDEGRSRLPDGTCAPEEGGFEEGDSARQADRVQGRSAPQAEPNQDCSAPQAAPTWKTTLRSVAWAQAQADEQFVASSEDRRLRRRAIAVEHQGQRVLELLAAYPDGRTARVMRDVLGVSGDRMSRLLDWLVEKGVVVKSEERYDRRRMIVTYSRVPSMDLSEAAIRARRVAMPDQKVYDIGTGHFRRGNAPAPGAVGVAPGGILQAAAGGTCDEPRRAVGRDTLFDRENSGNLHSSQAQREAASSVPSNPGPAAPGPGALPLVVGRDTYINGEKAQYSVASRAAESPEAWQAVRGQRA